MDKNVHSPVPSGHREPTPRPAESLLMDLVAGMRLAGPVLLRSQGRANLARQIATANRAASVDCWFTDLFRTQLAEQSILADRSSLHLYCQPDPPQRTYQTAFLPIGTAGESDFVREILQLFFCRLKIGGQLCVAVDNPRDRWLCAQMRRFARRIRVQASPKGVIYRCTKQAELRKLKNYAAEFTFRHGERLIRVYSRPDVFSHRRIDSGARQLLNVAEIRPGDRVLDIGCGSGVLSLAAAAVDPSVHVCALDSNARAIECTQRSADLNSVQNIDARLTSIGELSADEEFDVVLANPPYYADYRIAERFVEIASRAAASGASVFFVGKRPEWYADRLPQSFVDVRIIPTKGYWVAQATAR